MNNTTQLKSALTEALARFNAIDQRFHAGTMTPTDERALVQLADVIPSLQDQITTAERNARIASIGGTTVPWSAEFGPALGTDLASGLLQAGWSRTGQSAVTVDVRLATDGPGVRLKTGSVDSGVDGTEVSDRFVAPALGTDSRYLYPKVRSQGVARDATGVQSYRQKSRTLGTPANMIRTIDYTSAKEETDSVAEVVNEPLKMIANVSSGTPNILLANDSFRSWVNSDLLTAWRAALDYHITDEIASAGIGTGGGGSNVYEAVLYSMETVRAAGYSPDIVVVSPSDALAIQLLQMTGGDSYAFNQPLPSFVISPVVEDGLGFVADSQALGILFLGPFQFAAFEQNNGTTNTSTVRGESSGLFLVQRPDAAATLSGS